MAAEDQDTRSSVPRHFSRAALNYERLASVQHAVAEALARQIGAAAFNPESILEIGAGTGFLTRLLAGLFPRSQIAAIDPAEEALRLAAERQQPFSSADFIKSDLQNFRSDNLFDLITSSSALQWVHPLEEALKHIGSLLAPGGTIICSMLGEGTFGELHASRMAAAPQKPPRRALPRAEQVESAFIYAGLSGIKLQRQRYLAVYPDACSVLESARILGFTGGDLSEGSSALTRSELRTLITEYQRGFCVDGKEFKAACNSAILVKQEPAPQNPALRRAIGPVDKIPVYALTAAITITATGPERT